MDPRKNPFAPGAGEQPPELAGRDDLLERAAVSLDRCRSGLAARGPVLYGLRGVGKTVLLNRIRMDAQARGIACVRMEAVESRSLPAVLAPALRTALTRLSRAETAKSWSQDAVKALAGFTRALKFKFGDIEVGLDIQPEPGLADSGSLEADLTDLVLNIGRAAAEQGTAMALFVDELQYVASEQLGALLEALHVVNQERLPFMVVAAGLPQIVGGVGRAKSYAERLFEFTEVDRLDALASARALVNPARQQGASFTDAAIAEIVERTTGYPYFLQEWGKHSWDAAQCSPIRKCDVLEATATAEAELDAGFFRVRLDRLTPTEQFYLSAMASLGPGPHRSRDIALQLGRKVTAVAPTRNRLIAKGMVYSPAHGDTAFTVPLFDEFMRRVSRLPAASVARPR